MRIVGTFALLSFDLGKARKALDDELNDIMLQATRAWVRTVVSIVPTWSGASQSSIEPIARLVGVPVFSSPVSGAPDRRDTSKGQADFDISGPKKFFRWNTSVFHFIYNENNNANLVGFHLRNPGPYHSQRKARTAFQSVVRQRLSRLRSRITRHIKVTTRTVGAG
jgi:hypothetical protein